MKKLLNMLIAGGAAYAPLCFSEEVVNINTMGSYSLEALKVVVSLALVLMIFYIGITVFKKYLGGVYKGESSIRVLGGMSIGHKEKLVLVAAGKVRLLLGVSAAGVSKLHCFDEHEVFDEAQEEVANNKSFGQHLSQLTNKL